jgi:methenyltetrahydrofolate cyclohydrolase (EC 3.5.4.9)/5,10-methylenetetrahydrofolate dehydrogenase (NADP+) (EC 1.5.1.5)
MKIIDGKAIATKIKEDAKRQIDILKSKNQRIPKLAVILVGDNQASHVYVKNKEMACRLTGIKSQIIRLTIDATEQNLLDKISQLNKDITVDGILVQLPLPKHISEGKILNSINPIKDVDGFHPDNIAKLLLGQKGMVPCTPKGMITILENIGYELIGKEVVVVGRSNIVGKPISLLCLQRNATVTMAHSKTEDLKAVCKRADVLITAIGQPRFFDKDYVKEGAVILDVGINRDENNKLCGDVDLNDVRDKVAAITPVPGGVGPMTIAMLLQNTIEAYFHREGIQ